MEKQMDLRKEVEMKIQENVQNIRDPYRLGYHLTPLFGLMNDPNGLVHFRNKYHVFFQWNPFSTNHSNKWWGHVSTENFIDWEIHPPALVPDSWYDKDGCYSGSAVVHNDRLYLFYTGNVRREDGSRETYQCLAVSKDGIHFEKQGPVIHLPDSYTPHFRDPKVWKKTDRWYAVIGAQNKESKGLAVIFSSEDLIHWKEEGAVAGNGMNGLSNFGYMWECPDLFELNGRHILLVSPQGLEPEGYRYQNLYNSGFFVGSWDEKENRFVHGPFEEIDCGFDFYAPQTFLDDRGRRILIAWMGIGDEMEPYHPTVNNGWIHGLTLPRQLVLKDGQIWQIPLEELQSLRIGRGKNYSFIVKKDKTAIPLATPLQEIHVQIERMEGERFVISIGTYGKLIYRKNGTFTVERINLKTGNIEERTCPIGELRRMQLFLDRSSLEVFVNGGEKVFTLRIFPEMGKESFIALESEKEASIRLNIWDLREFKYDFQV